MTYTDKDYGSLAFAIITGDESTVNVAGSRPVPQSHDVQHRVEPQFDQPLDLCAAARLGHADRCRNTAKARDKPKWYGINQYLFYKMNCCWTAGLRFEWFRDEEGFVVTGLRPGNPTGRQVLPRQLLRDVVGLNYKPNGNWNIRPEMRYDWFDGEGQPYRRQQLRNAVPVRSRCDLPVLRSLED